MARRQLEDLEDARRFIHRHIGPSPAEIEAMLGEVGVKSLEDLVEKTVPSTILDSGSMGLAPARSEADVLAEAARMAARNKPMTSLIGMGYYDTITPPVILRNILENPGWYTAYTPYQPEISQGRLEALLNFQTMVMDLTGMAMANASLLDEGTAAAEAMTLAKNVAKSEANVFFVDKECHPQTLAAVETRAEPLGIQVVVGDPAEIAGHKVFGALIQYPGATGEIADP
ncbi:MAG: glycine dehydrogenase (aminomethyl-transferring), partial [Alphaproteobacteria bacterium]|nr:glycine dehydrogenase (aminomethyl-transferring) [Alphaproteobacteria bacterium]